MMSLTLQAWVIIVIFGLLTIALAVNMIMNFSPWVLFAFIIWLIQYAVVIYDTECLVAGGCNAWSWIRTILYCIVPTLVIIFMFVSLFEKKEKEQDPQEQGVRIVYAER